MFPTVMNSSLPAICAAFKGRFSEQRSKKLESEPTDVQSHAKTTYQLDDLDISNQGHSRGHYNVTHMTCIHRPLRRGGREGGREGGGREGEREGPVASG